MATDDRYRDDVHYRGGAKTMSEYSQYAVSQMAMNAMPPDPAFRGAAWREEWRDRLERTPPWLLEWFRQQHDGPYWRQGSLAPDYGAIEAAILQIGGWMDSYVDPVFRMHERCSVPRRSLVGPWAHSLPDSAEPGPNVDWLHELVRFFDRWLKDVPNDVMDEPGFTWFEREYTTPQPFPARLNGRWRATSTVPHPATRHMAWHLDGGEVPLVGRLDPALAAADGADRFAHRTTLGTRAALSWGAGPPPNGLARDLRPDEALVPTYTSVPLAEPLEILGIPVAVLHVSATAPMAAVVVRLTDVAPDGTSAQVSAGVLNLTHRESDERPEPLEPGCVYEVRVPLRAAGYRFLAGHRLRVSVASGSFPVIWPSPEPCELTIARGPATPSRVVLPVIPAAGGDGDLPPPAFRTERPDVVELGGESEEPPEWRIEEDVINGSVTVHVREAGTTDLPDGRSLFASEQLRMTASDADPGHARMDTVVVYRWREHTFETEIVATGAFEGDGSIWDLDLGLRVTLDGEPFFDRRWQERVPRRLV